MNQVQQSVLHHLRVGRASDRPDDYQFECDGFTNPSGYFQDEAQWVMCLSVTEYDFSNPNLRPWCERTDPGMGHFDDEDWEYEDESKDEYMGTGEIPTHVARVVTRNAHDIPTGQLSLVDGTQLYLVVNGDEVTSIWEDAWEGNQPDYYGGPIDEAIEWCGGIGEVFYTQIDSPFVDWDDDMDREHPNGGWPMFVDRSKIICE